MINNKKTKGFTMAEVLVSIAIFSLLSVALANIFVSAIKAQGKILLNQALIEESNYLLQYMGKALRMAEKDVDGDCTGGVNYLGDALNNGHYITFLAYDSVADNYFCRKFSLESDILYEYRSTTKSAANFGTPAALTSSKLKINDCDFYIVGDQVDSQPKITIRIELKGVGFSSSIPSMFVQTTISKRELNID